MPPLFIKASDILELYITLHLMCTAVTKATSETKLEGVKKINNVWRVYLKDKVTRLELFSRLEGCPINNPFRKGNRRVCRNYRGISLLSIPGKVFAKILLNRLSKLAKNVLPEAQCGSHPGWGTVDITFSVKIQEKCIEQNRNLYIVFVDFTKAFDTVHIETLWKILRIIGCPDLFVDLIASLHKDIKASVSLKGELSKPIDVQNGVKQGCVLISTYPLFPFSFQSPQLHICRLQKKE